MGALVLRAYGVRLILIVNGNSRNKVEAKGALHVLGVDLLRNSVRLTFDHKVGHLR